MEEKTTHCSYCDEQVRARRVNETDQISDYKCAECGRFILIEGNARREQLRREEGERIASRVKEFADRLEKRGGPEPKPSILEIKRELMSIAEEIDSIDAEIREETKLSQK